MRCLLLVPALSLFASSGAALAGQSDAPQTADAVLSADYRACFGLDAPLNAESHECLDRESRRLDALLRPEYRAALSRQLDRAARNRLVRDDHRWRGTRFRHCAGAAADLSGATAVIATQSCEIRALADRIAVLRAGS